MVKQLSTINYKTSVKNRSFFNIKSYKITKNGKIVIKYI